MRPTAFRPPMLVALGACLVVACESADDGQPVYRSLDGVAGACQICDLGRPRLTKLRGCRYDVDCPSGASCRSDVDAGDVPKACGDHPGCCSDPSTNGRCLIDGNADLNALTVGFQVASFTLQPVSRETSGATFTWRTPSDARIMECAVFGCPPRVHKGVDYGDRVERVIENYAQCVLADLTLKPADGTVDPANVPRRTFATNEETCSGPRLGDSPTTLLLGCWAYDESTVIAASTLVHLTPAQVGSLVTVHDDCTGVEGSCVLRDETQFGVCVDDHCRHRCMSDDDCLTNKPTEPVDAGPADAPGFICERASGAMIGSCAPAGGGS